MMEPREQSESMNNLEKDQILSTEPQNEPQEVVSEEVKVVETAPVEETPAEVAAPVEEAPAEPVDKAPAEPAAPIEETPKLDLANKSKSELVEMMRQMAARPIEEVKDEV